MRIELLYAPGCTNYRKARNMLETLIAEESWPCSIEMVEHAGELTEHPSVRVDGSQHKLTLNQLETLRDLLTCKWRDLTAW